MSEKKYSEKHEWVELNGDVATVGITKHATEQLGDIVFTEVPEKGKSFERSFFSNFQKKLNWKKINPKNKSRIWYIGKIIIIFRKI